LLPAPHTQLAQAKIERLVAEEYILDTINFFEGDRVECARRLAKGAFRPSCLHVNRANDSDCTAS
jgi:nuclear cap-binding protein subunit 1